MLLTMEKYISIKQIMDDILVHPLLKDLPLERAVNYAVEFTRRVGAPRNFVEKNEELEVQDYMAKLPCDYLKIIQVMDLKTRRAFRKTTDSFHLSHVRPTDLTYKIQNSVIITSIKCGKILISYQSIGTDKDGYPLIVDNASFIKALELYIKKEWFTILFDTGRISQQVFNNTLQAYNYAAAEAQQSLTVPDYDEMESITNMWNTLIPRMTEHDNGFATLGTREYIKRH